MSKSKRRCVGSIALAVLVAVGPGTLAQEYNVAGRTASENATAASSDGRAPGNMVRAGVFRAGMAVVFRPGFDHITQTERASSWQAEYMDDAIQIVIGQLTWAINLFTDLLLLRSGGSASINPTDWLMPTSPPSTDGGSATDAIVRPPPGGVRR